MSSGAQRSRDIWPRILRSSIWEPDSRPKRFSVRPADLGASAGHGSFAARSLHSSLRPPVEMTPGGAHELIIIRITRAGRSSGTARICSPSLRKGTNKTWVAAASVSLPMVLVRPPATKPAAHSTSLRAGSCRCHPGAPASHTLSEQFSRRKSAVSLCPVSPPVADDGGWARGIAATWCKGLRDEADRVGQVAAADWPRPRKGALC
jgi:hypothetical protein